MRSMVASWVAAFSRAEVGGEPVVAIVDGGDHVTGANVAVVVDRYARQVAGNFCGQRGVVRLHIGVVGRDREAADRPPVVAEPRSSAEPAASRAPRASWRRLKRREPASAARAAPPSFAVWLRRQRRGGALASACAGAGPVGSTSMFPRTRCLGRNELSGRGPAVPFILAIHLPRSSDFARRSGNDRTVRSSI